MESIPRDLSLGLALTVRQSGASESLGKPFWAALTTAITPLRECGWGMAGVLGMILHRHDTPLLPAVASSPDDPCFHDAASHAVFQTAILFSLGSIRGPQGIELAPDSKALLFARLDKSINFPPGG